MQVNIAIIVWVVEAIFQVMPPMPTILSAGTAAKVLVVCRAQSGISRLST